MTPMSEETDTARVIQADRDAAANVYDLLGFGPCQHIIDGVEDDIGVVQAFARHRLAQAAPAGDGREDVLEQAREYAALFWDRFDTPSHRDYSHAIRRGRKDDCEAVQVALLALAANAQAERDAEVVRLRATIERVRQAIEWVEPSNTDDRDAAITADANLSLRQCAAKHGVGVSVVRTIRARAALDTSAATEVGK